MADLISGKNTVFRVRLQGATWSVIVKSWSVEEVAVEVEDGVNGEVRDRLQKITKYYRTNIECYEDGSTQTITNILAQQANDDALQPQENLGAGILFQNQDGSKQAFILTNCTMGPYKGNSSGRTERFMHSLSIRSQYFQAVQAA